MLKMRQERASIVAMVLPSDQVASRTSILFSSSQCSKHNSQNREPSQQIFMRPTSLELSSRKNHQSRSQEPRCPGKTLFRLPPIIYLDDAEQQCPSSARMLPLLHEYPNQVDKQHNGR